MATTVTATTYTVFRCAEWTNVAGEGLSLQAAAEQLLTGDGYAFEIRQEGGLYELFISDGSRNSPRGATHLRSCVASGFVATDIEELYRKIVAEEWHGWEALTDADYRASMESLASEDEDDE